MRFKLLNTVKINGVYHAPGEIVDVEDKEIQEQIVKAAAGEFTKERQLSAAEILADEIPKINLKIAEKLVENGFDTEDKVSGLSKKQLKALGFGVKEVDKVYNSFDSAGDDLDADKKGKK